MCRLKPGICVLQPQSLSGTLKGCESWKEENAHATQEFHDMQGWNHWPVLMLAYIIFLDDK